LLGHRQARAGGDGAAALPAMRRPKAAAAAASSLSLSPLPLPGSS